MSETHQITDFARLEFFAICNQCSGQRIQFTKLDFHVFHSLKGLDYSGSTLETNCVGPFLWVPDNWIYLQATPQIKTQINTPK